MRRTVLAAVLVLCAAMPAPAQVTIDKAPVMVERRRFDPKNRPADMPRLHPKESAVAQSFFGVETRVGGNVIEKTQTEQGWRASVKVDSVRMALTLRITIWLPDAAPPKLVNHEEGHRLLAEHYYQDAEAIARAEAQKLIGQTISGTGPDAESAADNALRQAAEELGGRYMSQTDQPCARAQEIYDQITAHGTNAVKEEKAIAQAIERTARGSSD